MAIEVYRNLSAFDIKTRLIGVQEKNAQKGKIKQSSMVIAQYMCDQLHSIHEAMSAIQDDCCSW